MLTEPESLASQYSDKIKSAYSLVLNQSRCLVDSPTCATKHSIHDRMCRKRPAMSPEPGSSFRDGYRHVAESLLPRKSGSLGREAFVFDFVFMGIVREGRDRTRGMYGFY